MTEDPRIQGLLDLAEGYASQRDALRARVAELEAEQAQRSAVAAAHAMIDAKREGDYAHRIHLADEARDAAQAKLACVRAELAAHADGGGPAIDTLRRIEDALR